jgi:hypothetical protein
LFAAKAPYFVIAYRPIHLLYQAFKFGTSAIKFYPATLLDFMSFKTGGSWPFYAILSTHVVRFEEECILKCFEDGLCVGINYNSRITGHNCQLASHTLKNIEVATEDGWISYQILTTVSTVRHGTTH